MKKIKLILCLVFLTLVMAPLVISGETRNIEYSIRVTSNPYCETISCSNVTSVNSTNTTCSEKCYNKIVLEGVDGNNLYVEIDSGEDKWKVENTEFRYGYKTADLGNLSDITGIREDLRNCTTGWTKLIRCQDTLRIYDVNLTNCKNKVGDNYSIGECKLDKTKLENQLSTKNSELNTKTEEIKDKKNEKWFFAVGGLIAGILIIFKGVPWYKGRDTPKDNLSKQFAPNPGM